MLKIAKSFSPKMLKIAKFFSPKMLKIAKFGISAKKRNCAPHCAIIPAGGAL